MLETIVTAKHLDSPTYFVLHTSKFMFKPEKYESRSLANLYSGSTRRRRRVARSQSMGQNLWSGQAESILMNPSVWCITSLLYMFKSGSLPDFISGGIAFWRPYPGDALHRIIYGLGTANILGWNSIIDHILCIIEFNLPRKGTQFRSLSTSGW